MVRRGCGEIAKKILDVLSSSPNEKMSIQEISKKADVNWDSTKRHLDLFKTLNIVRESLDNEKPVYQKIRPLEMDTLFSIPLSEEHKEKIKRVYATIRKVWDESIKKPWSKTLVQKIAVEVVEKKFPEIPRAWYLYGQVLLLPLDLEKEYKNPFEDKEVKEYIIEVCNQYSAFESAWKVRRHQYQTKKNNLYLAKENLSYCLNCGNFEDNTIKNKIRKYINEFAFSWERKEGNADILAIMEDFCSTTLSIFRNVDNNSLCGAKPAILDCFNAIWHLVGTYEFYDSLIQFYDQELLNDFLSEKIKALKEIALESLEELREHEPKLEYSDEASMKLKSLMGSVKEMTSEEKKAKNEKVNSEDLFKKYGL